MKKTAAITLLVLAFGVTGCGTMSTIDSRSKEMSSSYAAASPREQNLMQRGLVAAGFTPNMVYIALDRPDTVTKLPDGHTERWIYKNFGQLPGSVTMGATKVTTNAGGGMMGAGGSNAQYYRNTYNTRQDPSQAIDASQQHLVLTFTDGKLTAMELMEM